MCRRAAERLAAASHQPPVQCPAEIKAQSSGKRWRLLVKIWTWQSLFFRLLGETGPACQLLERSRTLLEGPELANQDTCSEQAAVLREMGKIFQLWGNRKQAGRLYAQCLALYQALGDRWMTAGLLTTLGKMPCP